MKRICSSMERDRHSRCAFSASGPALLAGRLQPTSSARNRGDQHAHLPASRRTCASITADATRSSARRATAMPNALARPVLRRSSTEETFFGTCLYSSGIPDPELIIRTERGDSGCPISCSGRRAYCGAVFYRHALAGFTERDMERGPGRVSSGATGALAA